MRKARAATRWFFTQGAALTQLGLGIAGWLLAYSSLTGLPTTWAEAGRVAGPLGLLTLLGAGLALVLKAEPLAIGLDYRTQRLVCYRPGLPWVIRLPLPEVSSRLAPQASHRGPTYYLVISTPRGVSWAVAASAGWPLPKLRRLHDELRRALVAPTTP